MRSKFNCEVNRYYFGHGQIKNLMQIFQSHMFFDIEIKTTRKKFNVTY